MIAPQPGRVQKVVFSKNSEIELHCEYGLWSVSFLEKSIIRVQFSPFGVIAPQRDWNPVSVHNLYKTIEPSVEEAAEHVLIKSPTLGLKVDKQTAQFFYLDANQKTIFADKTNLQIKDINLRDCKIPLYPGDERLAPTAEGRTQLILTKQLNDNECYYGLGQRALVTLDRRGEKLTNWNVDPQPGHAHAHDNLYQSHPVLMALNETAAWGFYVNTTWYNQWDVGLTERDTLAISLHGGTLDCYFIYGPTPTEFTAKLTGLTGRPLLPPMWGYGYQQCRWSYFTDDEVREVVKGFRSRQIPLDVIHLDIDYMDGYRCFTWNPQTFSNPRKLLSDLMDKQVRAIAIIDPGIKYEIGKSYQTANQLTEMQGYIRDTDGKAFVGNVWPDKAFFPDFARADVRGWWGTQHSALTNVGIAGIWQDMNEPANFDRPFSEEKHLIRHRPVPLDCIHGTNEYCIPSTDKDCSKDTTIYHAEVHNAYGYLMCRATYEGLCKLQPNNRPWTLTRAGMTGTQKYAMAWMGDNSAWWEHMEVSVQQMISMGLCGMPNVGVDIGGFWENCNPELYARWIQLGTFYPFMRTHSDLHSNRQEPWVFGPEVEAIAKRAIERRYELLPYLYSVAFCAHDDGIPIVRPMFFDHHSDPKTWNLATQFMFGPSLCVAPILRPGQTSREVYLPAGNWYQFGSNQLFQGGQYHLAKAPLATIPVYVRGGAVIPQANIRQSTQQPIDCLTFHAYPAPISTTRQSVSPFLYFEDDGVSFEYQTGNARKLLLSCVQESPSRVSVCIETVSFRPFSYQQTIRLYLPKRPQDILINGTKYSWWIWLDTPGCIEALLDDKIVSPEKISLTAVL